MALPLDFEDIGPQRVKNLEAPVRAYLARPSGEPRLRALPLAHRRVVSHLARRFHTVCHAALMEVTGPENLEPVDFAALASLNDAPGIGPDRLVDRMGIDLSGAWRIVRRLERRGFVKRSPTAGRGRSYVFGLTPAGENILERLSPAMHAAQERVMAPLSDRERDMLINLLTRIIKVGDAQTGDDSNS
jgi:DNA-binding MarR family transcriptional regulator